MTLQTITRGVAWPNLPWLTAAPTAVTTEATLDAAGEYLAFVFIAKEAMTISHIGFKTGAVAGSPTIDVRVETVDATTGIPTGTLWAANTNIVTGALSATTFALHALTASASVNEGDAVAILLQFATGTSAVIQRTNSIEEAWSKPYSVTNVTGSAVKSVIVNTKIMAIGSGATTFYNVPGCHPIPTISANAFSNSVAGDARGLRFKVPFKCRAAGIISSHAVHGDFTAGLYDDSGTELSSSATTQDSDVSSETTGRKLVYLDNKVTLSPDTWYRAILTPTEATTISMYTADLPSADYRSATPYGVNAHYTTFTTAGGWVDTATSQQPFLQLLLDQLDDGAGAAGGLIRHPGMSGGINA